MILMPLMLAGSLAFGHGPAADQRPFRASRADAIRAAAAQAGAQAPSAAATSVRYPSADGDILARLGPSIIVPPLKPARPIVAAFPSMNAPSAPDTSGLLGGPKR